MNQTLFEKRCGCNEEVSVKKKRKVQRRSEGKPLPYPTALKPLEKLKYKTFRIKYDGRLSLLAKFILNSFQNKFIYYGIDDILYQFKLDSREYETLLAILYSPIISLQNNYLINFFNIWINEIYIEEDSKFNKFSRYQSQSSSQFTFITVKFFYKTKVPPKSKESFW